MDSEISIASLMESISKWEAAGYCSTVAVAIGCIGESIHDFTNWFQRDDSWWKKFGGKLSALVLILALACEVITQVKANGINGQIISRLNLETEQLKERQRARVLTGSQMNLLTSEMKHFAGDTITVNASIGNVEALDLAIQIRTALEAGRLKVADVSQTTVTGFKYGAIIMVKDQPDTRSLVIALQHSLNEVGIDAPVVIEPTMADDQTQLIVGQKPQ